MSTPPLTLARRHWPEPDCVAWDALFTEGGVFDDRGRCADWSEGSRRKRTQSYGQWLRFLEKTNRLESAVSPADRFTTEAVRAFVEDARARIAQISTASLVVDLYVLATLFDPHRDWSWFKKIADRLRRQTAYWQVKPRLAVSAGEIFGRALAEMEAAEKTGMEDGRMMRSVRFRDGLMIALLIARPLRLRAFIGIQLGTHLVEHGDSYRLCFSAADMKDRKAREFDLPQALVIPMRRYLDHYRPALLKDGKTTALWVSRRGGPLSRIGFSVHLLDLTTRLFGVPMRPHAFRHVAATSIAEEDPIHVNVIASLLGHATLAMAEKHYNLASGVKAAASYQGMIGEHRRVARGRERSVARDDSTEDPLAVGPPRVGRSKP